MEYSIKLTMDEIKDLYVCVEYMLFAQPFTDERRVELEKLKESLMKQAVRQEASVREA